MSSNTQTRVESARTAVERFQREFASATIALGPEHPATKKFLRKLEHARNLALQGRPYVTQVTLPC